MFLAKALRQGVKRVKSLLIVFLKTRVKIEQRRRNVYKATKVDTNYDYNFTYNSINANILYVKPLSQCVLSDVKTLAR